MLSKNWKFLVLAPLAVALTACQHGHDEAESPRSPYTGFWMSSQSQYQLEACRRTGAQTQFQSRPSLDVLVITGDGGAYRYQNREVWANAQARTAYKIGSVKSNGEFTRMPGVGAYGYDTGPSITAGVFGKMDGNHMFLMDVHGSEQRSFVRTTEAQLQNYQIELLRCMGYAGHQQGWGARQPQLPPWQQPGYQRPPVPGEQGWQGSAQPPAAAQRGDNGGGGGRGQLAEVPRQNYQPQVQAQPGYQQYGAPPIPQQQEAYPPGYTR